ncbi:MAG TPA: hypothetical protein VFC26_15545, partial [Verrucomicrobiae bacterium]|nr:hypothetical protein [Verrucomicrobiae bacterium]
QRTVQILVNRLVAKGSIEKVPGLKRRDPMRYDVRPLLLRLVRHAKDWALRNGKPIPQPKSNQPGGCVGNQRMSPDGEEGEHARDLE